MARVYADVNARLGPSWYDYESTKVDWNVPDRYEIVRRIGGGRYSEVFEGIDSSNEESCVIKVLKPVAKKKIKREIKILRNLAGGPNVIRLMDTVHDPPSRSNSLVMEYVQNTDWKDLYGTLTEMEIKFYLFQLLRALDFVHSRGIIHRDVKPGNIMFDRSRRKLRLIDWGLAEFYHPGTELHIRVASRYFKGPELLVGYKHYDYSLDLWSVGTILAALIFRREHFFRGRDNEDQLLKIVKVLGTDDFERYLTTYRLYLQTYNDDLLQSYAKQPWSRFVTQDNKANVSSDGIDLLDKLLRYNHQERLTAAEALAHSFFSTCSLSHSTPQPRGADRPLSSPLPMRVGRLCAVVRIDAVRLETPSNPAECVSDSGFYST
ncbi:Pkinase-domain-containing protein [Lentinus tigrinus ALCF2SS1-7]|uniref:Casein kinase II subunit alpha n=1 Tax=Lentinus tigrinus ALCF2SS1-6 TaxID=1328759 RepID=A0A5C2SKA3_9APHY|nr:Pkinase-domain-containing protein [Lentinus tigrinus ALCF2SS1-6]RPD76282.1 Pkinase-domain-containing protein [Lentinus tigrinus ALCF2SS1-7]